MSSALPDCARCELPAHGPTLEQLAAVFWSTLENVAGKEAVRDDLVDGSAFEVKGRCELAIARVGDAGGLYTRLSQRFAGKLTVGHAMEKSTSSTPKLPEVLATVLLALGPKKRAELLEAIAVAFEQERSLSPPAESVAQAEAFLARLRTTKTTKSRGPVRAEYSLSSR